MIEVQYGSLCTRTCSLPSIAVRHMHNAVSAPPPPVKDMPCCAQEHALEGVDAIVGCHVWPDLPAGMCLVMAGCHVWPYRHVGVHVGR